MRGMRRNEKKVSYEQARDILTRAEYGILSTTCDDGLPYGIPLSFSLAGNAVYFHSANEGQKLDNLLYDSRACLTAVTAAQIVPEGLTMRYESAMAFGTVRILADAEERLAALRLLAAKYAPTMSEDVLNAYLCRQDAKTTVLRMDIEYLCGKCSPAGGQSAHDAFRSSR